MGKKNLGERIHYVPLIAAAQKTGATFSTGGINMGLFNQVEFICQLGAAATADFTVTAEECTATGGTSNDAVAAEYRVGAAAGTDTMGAVTVLATTGLAIANATYDNKLLVVTVDSDSLTDTHKYVRLTFTDPGTADLFIAVVAACHPRYQQATPTLALT